MMMDSKKISSPYIIWMLVVFVSLFSVMTQAQQFYIEGPTTVNFGELRSYSLKDSSHPNGNLLGEFEEVWWSGDVMILNNDYGTEKTVNASWDMRIEKDIWLCVSFYESITEEYYYVETFVTVLPPTPSAPTILSSNCNEVVLQRTSPPIFTSSSEPSWYVNDVIWYWQSTADGTSTANSASTITLTSGNQYFLRAKSIADYGEDYGTWSAASSSISYTIGNPAPIVGTITQPTASTPTGSVELSGLPASGTWTINPGGITGTGTSTTISGLAASTTYNFTVTISGCISAASSNAVIGAQPSGAITPTLSAVIQPGCTSSTGSFTITNYNASYTYSTTPSTGVVITGATVTAPAGSYTITAIYSGTNSTPSASVTVNAPPTTPATPIIETIIQPTTTISTGSVVLSGLPATGTWTINPGNIVGTGTTTTISGLNVYGTYYFTVANESGCVSQSSTAVVFNSIPIHLRPSNENYIYTILPQVETTDILTLLDDQKQESIAYYDGLGRPMQKIVRQGGGNRQDIITPIVYDYLGRQNKDYLPYPRYQSGLNIENSLVPAQGDRDAVITAVNNYYLNKYPEDFAGLYIEEVNPFSFKRLEASPLNRVLEVAAPGASWWGYYENGQHTIKFEYKTNIESDHVKYYSVSFLNSNIENPQLVSLNEYAPYELYKNITKDENWKSTQTYLHDHTSEEFKNKQGQIVLKRRYNNDVAHDTYYVYDDYGNLTFVLPPKVDTADGVSQTELDNLCYQYKYDYRNRLIAKKLPGKEWEYIVYDKLDRPVLTQDPNLQAQNKWLFTKYDAFSRPVYTGLMSSSKNRAGLQADLNLETIHFESRGTTPIDGINTYYTNNSFPNTGIIELHTINYYDDYNFDKDGGVSEPVGTNPQVTPSTATKSLATGSKIRVLGSPNWITNVIYYDGKGRPIYNYSKNDFLSTIQKVKTELDFVGKPTKTTTTHERNNLTTTVVDNFTYDHQGRLLTQIQKINNQGEELLVSNEYDELGQLFKKGVGGKATTSNRLQTVDYTYNIRGWLKGINDGDANNEAITMGTGDLFGFQINYNDGPTDPLKKLYNGNISQTYWKTTNPIDTNLKNYNYSYDALNRLTEAQYSLSTPNRYNENLTYDKNGNIMSLVRNGYTDSGATQLGTMDNLAYSYDAGNKLFKVKDNSASNEGFKDGADSTLEYTYDDNGNMKTDDNKGITAITYNHLNLPTSVAMAGGTINYTYDATGVKQRKTLSTGTTTDYAGGFQYKDNILQFLPTAEGYAEYNNGNGIFSYIYQYKDHLGNVRLSYKDVGTTTPNLQIVEESNYYPFGMKQKVAGEVINNSSYKYKYNGKELQDELGLNVYDYGFRLYDPAIGRMQNPDPLAELAYDLTPNRYCFNNPVNFIDPTGLWETIAGGYTTDKPEDIKRFMSFMGFENNALNNSPTFEQKSSFIEGEMSPGGHGKTSDGNILADEITIVGTKQKGEDFKNGYVDKSFQDFYHGVQRSLTPDALDPRTVGQQFFGFGGLTYPGPSNPKTYAGNDDYSYVPKRPEEFPAIAHDLAYNDLRIKGAGGLFTAKSASVADYKFVTQELAITLNPIFSMRSRVTAGVLGVGLGLAALPKTVLDTRSTSSMDMQTNATIMGH